MKRWLFEMCEEISFITRIPVNGDDRCGSDCREPRNSHICAAGSGPKVPAAWSVKPVVTSRDHSIPEPQRVHVIHLPNLSTTIEPLSKE